MLCASPGTDKGINSMFFSKRSFSLNSFQGIQVPEELPKTGG